MTGPKVRTRISLGLQSDADLADLFLDLHFIQDINPSDVVVIMIIINIVGDFNLLF